MAYLSAYGEGVFGLALVWLNLPTGTVGHCSVATIFGLNTADCNNKSFETVPVTLRDDIKVLKFNENQLTTVENDAFRFYPMLQEIYLVRNRIRTLSSDAFRGLYNLQILDLEGNTLASVPTNAFHNLQAVRILRLGGNPIRAVGANSLRPLRKVEELSFENCLISRFDPRALVDLRDLTELNLVNNELTWIDGSMGDLLPPNLAVMRLHRNPWKCDCRLRWFRQRVATLSWEFGRDAPNCASPDLLRGILWSHLSAEQFACPSQIIPSGPTAFEMKPGSNVTVECLVAGDPEPSVWWTKASKTVDRTRVARNYLWTLAKEQRILSLLFLTDVGLSQAGDYKCIAENSAGRSEATYRLWLAGTDPSAPEAVVELSLGQRIVIGVSIGVTCLLFVAALLVGLIVSQRRRWVNAYKVTDSISNSNCYTTKNDSAAIISKCSPKTESARNSKFCTSKNSTLNHKLSSKNDSVKKSNSSQKNDITCNSNFSLTVSNSDFSPRKDMIDNSNILLIKDSNNSDSISRTDSLGHSTSTAKTNPVTGNSLNRPTSNTAANKPRVVRDRCKTEDRNQAKSPPKRVGGDGGGDDVSDTSGQAININHDKTLMKRVQIRVDQGRKLTTAAIDVDAETNEVRRRPPDSFVATFGQSGPAVAGGEENGCVNANGIGYFVGKRTTAAAAEAKTEATTTMAEHKERRTTAFQMKVFSRSGVTS